MKKQKTKHHFKCTGVRKMRSQSVDLQPEEVANYMHCAEQYALPIINELQIPPAAAFFLLTQYAQALVIEDQRMIFKNSAFSIANASVLWEAGFYTPSLDYPYTLQETLHDQRGDSPQTQDYSGHFQPFCSFPNDVPRWHKSIPGGIVRHPETQLWQIWLIIDGPCDQLAAYQDMNRAQQGLRNLIMLLRKSGKSHELQAFCQQLRSQSDGKPKRIPFAMLQYLLEHLDVYKIDL